MKYSLSRFSVGVEHVKAARRALESLVTAIQKDDAGVIYLVFQEPDRPVFFTLVSFQDEAQYRRHATSAHAARFARTILPLCDGKPSFVGLELLGAASRLIQPRSKATGRRARGTTVRVPAGKRRRS